MNVQLNSVSETRKDLVVTLDPAEVGAEHQAVVGDFIRLARIPGFRPGKAPAAMVAQRFGKEIAGEFKQKVVARAYREALEKEKLNVLSIVDVKEGSIEPGAAASITVTVDVAPEITLPDYTGLPTQVEPDEPTDAEVENVIQGIRSERADFKPVDRPARKGDYVKLSYEGSAGGKPIAEIVPDRQIYGKVPQTWEEVEGANEGVIPGLGGQLAGLGKGDKKKVPVSFPADFAPVPALAGQAAEYAVEVLEVRERVLPELDAEFFKAQGVADLEALRAQVRDALRRQKKLRNLAAQRRQVTEALAAKVDCPVPQSLVEAETQGMLRHFLEDNLRRGVAPENFEKDKQRLFEEAREAAARRVKVQLLLAKVAEAEKIEAADRDVEQYIAGEAARSNQRPEKVARDLAQDRERLRAARQSIIFDKTVDFLVSKATVGAVAGSPST